MDENSIFPLLALVTGLPPAAPTHPIPAIPSILLLVAAIVRSTNRLFFVSCKFGNNDAREWRLAQVAFLDLMSLYPLCTLDGRFLFEFYICHPADWGYNAINQRYWLQLHSMRDLASPCSTTDTHLVRPTDTSDSYVPRHKLMPFRNGLIYVIWTHISTGHSSSLPFTVAKPRIVLPSLTGMSFIGIN
jgi:hypothetical protein